MSSIAVLSDAISTKWGALPGGPIGISLKKAPQITGESTSVSSDTGPKLVREPDQDATGRAVPSFHPAGAVRFA